MKILAGTSKGLVILTQESGVFKITAVHFEGYPISMIYVDEVSGYWWAGISHRHWGQKIHKSEDEGRTWTEMAVPSYRGYFQKPGTAATLRRVWAMQRGGNDYWLGTEPGGLFHSTDSGESWQLVESLWNHPSRTDEKQWFGAGKDDPFLHSIVIDPADSRHLYIGVSCAGVFETRDLGKTWAVRNNGLKAAYLPNPQAEIGHDPHRLLMVQGNTKVIWQQNHCGIYRSVNGGETWVDVSGPNGFPGYGFALAIDHANEDRAWVIPAQSDDMRLPPQLQLTVCRTDDGGKSWKTLTRGLPAPAFDLVLRHSLVRHGNFLCFGTTNGNLYSSTNDGEEWKTIATNLAGINSLSVC